MTLVTRNHIWLFLTLVFFTSCRQESLSSRPFNHSHVTSTELLPLKEKTEPMGFDGENIPKEFQMILQQDSTVGIWRADFNYKQYADSTRPIVAIIWPSIFKFDGTYLTAPYMIVINSWTGPSWMSKDGYYKMKTQWVDDTLKYLTPHLNWEEAGVFNDNVFSTLYTITDTLNNAKNYTIYFRKIQPTQVEDYEKPILKYRKAYRYDQAW